MKVIIIWQRLKRGWKIRIYDYVLSIIRYIVIWGIWYNYTFVCQWFNGICFLLWQSIGIFIHSILYVCIKISTKAYVHSIKKKIWINLSMCTMWQLVVVANGCSTVDSNWNFILFETIHFQQIKETWKIES